MFLMCLLVIVQRSESSTFHLMQNSVCDILMFKMFGQVRKSTF